MAARKNKSMSFDGDVPKTLTDHPFYGMTLDDEQVVYRDNIWNPNIDIVFCNAKAGTGKTTIAIGVANMLVKYGLYDGIAYIVSPTQEEKQGYLPGDQESKSAPYMEPLYEALETISVNPNTAICSPDNMNAIKNGDAFVRCMTHTYLRGCNFEKQVIILDESQNYYFEDLKKVLSRIHDNCKVIVIGHTGQIDLYKHPENSGFARYIEHFSEKPRTAVCQLTTNHRGWISTWADALEI